MLISRASALALGRLAGLASLASLAGLAIAAAAAAVAGDRAAPDLLPPAASVPGCLVNGAGYLRARIRGAVRLDIDWHGVELQCEGSARPDGSGIRLSFAGPLPRSRARMRMIFGIAGASEGRPGRALPTNLTVIFEGERRLYSTRGDDKCTVDSLLQEPLGPAGGAARSYRVVARGFCFEPVSDLIRNDRLFISRFDFAGRIAFPQETFRSPP